MSTSASRDDAGDTANPKRRHPLPRHFNHGCGNPSSVSGSSKLGVVTVGLGLLVMGDIARGGCASLTPPSIMSTAFRGRGEAEIVPCRRGGGGNGVDSGKKTGGFVVSGGFVGGRRRIRRRAGSSTCGMMVQQQQEHQQVSQTSAASGQVSGTGPPSSIAGMPASSPLSATASAAASTAGPPPSASRTPSNGAGSSVASAAVPASGTAVGVVSTPRRLGVISRAKTGAAQGGGRGRLGVLSSAENGSTAAKKAKVKAMYFRARNLLRGNPPASREAIAMLEQALQLDPRDGHSWLLLARTQERTGDIAAARGVFSRATEACARNAHLWQAWGMLEDKFGDRERARSLFDEGLKVDPGNPFVCHAWGLMEQRDGCADRARELFKISRPRVALTTALGELEASQGNIQEARNIFQEGLDRLRVPSPAAAASEAANRWTGPGRRAPGRWNEPAEGPGEILIAWAKLEERAGGDNALAMQLMEQAKAGDPANVKAHIERARFEMRQGNMATARVILSEAADLPQKEGNLFNMWATLETREGNLDTALKIAQAATERFPHDMSLLQTQGTVHGRLGQHEEAIECYRRSIAIRPAAPAYVAWALIVAKLAARVEKDRSTKGTEQAVKDVNDEDNFNSRNNGGLNGAATTSLFASVALVNGDATLPVQNPDTDTEEDDYPSSSSTVGDSRTDVVREGIASASDAQEESEEMGQTGRKIDDKLGSYQEARRLFELGIAADPAHGPLYNAYGTMEAKIGNLEHARDVYKRGIAARCCGMASVWQGLGALEASVGNRDGAREIFLRGARESTHDASFLYHSLGSLELTAMRLEEARSAFVEGIARYPKNTQLLLGAALAETKIGNTDESRDYFKRAVQADSSHAHAWQAWGVMEARLGNHEIARSLWESGLKANPLHGPLWQAYAVLEDSLGEHDLARKLFAAGVERCPDHVQLHQAWAVMEGRDGNLGHARKLVMDGLRVDPYHGALWTVYSTIERQDGSDGKARKVCELGTRACPKHGPLYRSWGQMEFQSGNTADARRVFERGLKNCPTYVSLYYAFGDMEATMGNTEFLEELKDKGKRALMEGGISPAKLEEYEQQMEAFATVARFDAKSTWDRNTEENIFDLEW